MDRILEILINSDWIENGIRKFNYDKAKVELASYIDREIIGENETEAVFKNSFNAIEEHTKVARNALRAEQRRKLEGK